jgi:hypothetical protein
MQSLLKITDEDLKVAGLTVDDVNELINYANEFCTKELLPFEAMKDQKLRVACVGALYRCMVWAFIKGRKQTFRSDSESAMIE